MNAAPPVTFTLDADGVGWITFDDPAARANVLHAVALAALGAALDTATAARPKVLVLASGKDNTFVAGADLKQVAGLHDPATAADFSRAGQRLFSRLADFSVPVVAAIHGACAGGGFELALACHWRIASDAATTRIGLPETSLGTIPGWGGGVRLPALIGARAALGHLLQAQLLPALAALHDGLVDEVVPATELRRHARAAGLKFAATGRPLRAVPPVPAADFFPALRHQTLASSRGRQPALLAAIEVVERTAALPLPAALELEARAFGTVTAGPVCKNFLHAFSVREAARKQTLIGWFDGAEPPPLLRPRTADGRPRSPISRVGVVGAGVMGSGIAHWLAAHGCDVVLRDVQPDLVMRGLRVVRGLFDDAIKRGRQTPDEAAAGFARVTATTEWDGFANCDLVVEAIVENAAAKQALFSELARVVRPDTLLASNTSALPIEEIAGHVPNPARTLGLHFFNPVSRMPLVELVLGRQTGAAAAERALALVKALGKSPVICRSSPGFLVTRVLFFYLNEAVRLWEAGVPTATLDAALRDFGWPMGPLRLIDEVGIDVTDFIFAELAHYFPARFERSTACHCLLAAGWKGRKNGTGSGFYRYDGRVESANDAATRPLLATAAPPARPRSGRGAVSHLLNDKPSGELTPGKIDCHLMDDQCAHLMGVMIDEARRCLAEGVVRSSADIDFALLSGAGFPAFRGGLMRYARQAPLLAPALSA